MKSKKLGLFLFIVQFALCLSLVVSASALESTDSIDVSYTVGAESLTVGTGETVTVYWAKAVRYKALGMNSRSILSCLAPPGISLSAKEFCVLFRIFAFEFRIYFNI